MRTVIQRVKEASVTIGPTEKAVIGRGILVLLGIEGTDTEEDIQWLSGKIARLRIFSDEQGLMNRSIQDIQGSILVVSQFTLYASTRKGNRPSFTKAARPEISIPLYNFFLKQMEKDLNGKVESGEFGAEMQVQLINDGPVTIVIDTKNKQ